MIEITKDNFQDIELNGIIIAYPKTQLEYNSEYFMLINFIDVTDEGQMYAWAGYNMEDGMINGFCLKHPEKGVDRIFKTWDDNYGDELIFNHFNDFWYYKFDDLNEFVHYKMPKQTSVIDKYDMLEVKQKSNFIKEHQELIDYIEKRIEYMIATHNKEGMNESIRRS